MGIYTKYIVDIIDCAHLTNAKTDDTPFDVNVQYSSFDDNPLPNSTLYHSIVGNLVYLIITYPNIAYIIHIVS